MKYFVILIAVVLGMSNIIAMENDSNNNEKNDKPSKDQSSKKSIMHYLIEQNPEDVQKLIQLLLENTDININARQAYTSQKSDHERIREDQNSVNHNSVESDNNFKDNPQDKPEDSDSDDDLYS